MSARDRGRLGRLFGRDDGAGEPADDSVSMSGNDDHAWWADRRSLSGAPSPMSRERPADPLATDSPAEPEADRWSAEALFADAGFATGETTPPPVDDGSTTTVIANGIDEARLILGVGPDADAGEITKAHRKLAKQFHPDRLGDLSPDAQELGQQRMAEINRAFETLKDHVPA